MQNPYAGKIQEFTPDKGLYLSALGTPVMQDLTFKSVKYTDFSTGTTKQTQDITLIDILIRVNQPSIIEKTKVQGRNGTVKESVGVRNGAFTPVSTEDDWQITINGFLLGNNGQNPTSAIIELKNVARARVAIPVLCSYLNNLDIFNIVIEDFELVQEPGGYSKQAFTISAVSDEDVQLMIK